MKAVVKVSHLRTDDALYRRGDTVDLPEERIMQLGSSVVRTEPEPEVVEEPATEPEGDAVAEESAAEIEAVVEEKTVGPDDDADVEEPNPKPAGRGRKKR